MPRGVELNQQSNDHGFEPWIRNQHINLRCAGHIARYLPYLSITSNYIPLGSGEKRLFFHLTSHGRMRSRTLGFSLEHSERGRVTAQDWGGGVLPPVCVCYAGTGRQGWAFYGGILCAFGVRFRGNYTGVNGRHTRYVIARRGIRRVGGRT